MTYCPSRPGHRRRVDAEDHRHRRLVDGRRRNRQAVLGIRDRLADGDVVDAGHADDVARAGALDVDALEAFEREQLRDLGVLVHAVELEHRDLIADADGPVEDAADGDAAQVVARVEVGDQQLQRRRHVAARRRHMRDDGVEQRPQVLARHGQVRARRPGAGAGVEHGKLDLLFGGVQIDEQVVDLVEHRLGARVRTVDLVDDDHRHQAAGQRLAQHEPRLRQRAFRGVHQQHDAVHHRQRALDLAAEIGVARRVDDVDQHVVVVHGRVLGQDGDAALALEVVAVHHALDHALVGAEDPALMEHGVDQRGLAVVDVRDDGDVAPERVGDTRLGFLRGRHPFSIADCRLQIADCGISQSEIATRYNCRMPIYEYGCRQCGARFEVLVRGQETPQCPGCQSADLEKALSTFAVGGRQRRTDGQRPGRLRPLWRSAGPGGVFDELRRNRSAGASPHVRNVGAPFPSPHLPLFPLSSRRRTETSARAAARSAGFMRAGRGRCTLISRRARSASCARTAW